VQVPHAQREKILELLEHEGGVTEESVRKVAAETGVPEADIWGAGMFYTLIDRPGKRVRVCDGLTCQMMGADQIAQQVSSAGRECERVSCLGQCDLAPATLDEEMELVTYAEVKTSISPASEQLALNLAGPIDLSYSALEKARTMGADQVIEQLKVSGLQGRGGAGFPAHFKWTSVRSQEEIERYVICNADEAEPGTFKDRETILRQPHKMLEGLAIAAATIGTKSIYIYIRGEYTNEYRALQAAIVEVKDAQLSDFEIEIVKGHGAYICGEESAMIESIEGKRGLPRHRPPYVAQVGIFGRPTLVHNVETLYWITKVCRDGPEVLNTTELNGRKGLRSYSVSGRVAKPGVYLLPAGSTITDIIDAAGGMTEGHTFKAYQPGGPSSGLLPASINDVPLDFDTLQPLGSFIGSAAVVVLSDADRARDAALNMLRFFEDESCGQCTPCRTGCEKAVKLMQADSWDQPLLADLCTVMEDASICGLGQAAPNPIRLTMKHFGDEV